MTLGYLSSINSKEDDTRREYLETIGFEMPKPNFKYLNEKLGTLFKYNIPSAKPTKDNIKIVFGVGSGHDENIATHSLKIAERKTKPCIAKLSLDKNETLDPYGNTDLVKIIPMYLADVRKGLTPDYKVFTPMSYTNIWYRKYYTKLTQNNIFTDFGVDGDSDKLHIECTLTKDDLNIGPFVNDNKISELCVYAGVNVQMFDKPTSYPPSYFNQVHPKEDLIDVVPLFKIQFEPILIDNIPKTGLTFIFDVNTDSEIATVIESEEDTGTTEEWDTQFVESVHAGTGNYGNSADNINQNLNQNRVVISRGIVSNTRQIWLTGKLSNLDKWLSTNPGQQDDQHNWFALDLVFKKESLDAGLLWRGEYDINDDLLDLPEGPNTLTLWLKLDELATQPKVITIVNKNDPDDVETITIKFINQED